MATYGHADCLPHQVPCWPAAFAEASHSCGACLPYARLGLVLLWRSAALRLAPAARAARECPHRGRATAHAAGEPVGNSAAGRSGHAVTLPSEPVGNSAAGRGGHAVTLPRATQSRWESRWDSRRMGQLTVALPLPTAADIAHHDAAADAAANAASNATIILASAHPPLYIFLRGPFGRVEEADPTCRARPRGARRHQHHQRHQWSSVVISGHQRHQRRQSAAAISTINGRRATSALGGVSDGANDGANDGAGARWTSAPQRPYAARRLVAQRE